MQKQLHDYFQSQSDRIKYCYYHPLVEARPIEAGELFEGGLAHEFNTSIAPDAGFIVQSEYGPEFCERFEFHQNYIAFEEWLKKAPRSPLAQETTAKPVEKGEMISVQPRANAQIRQNVIASENGWFLEDHRNGSAIFMDDISFRSIYETHAHSGSATKHLYRQRTPNIDTKLPFVMLERDRLFRDQQNIPHNLRAGSFLVQIPGSLPREYIPIEASAFFRKFALNTPLLERCENTKVIRVDFKKRILKASQNK